MTPSGLEERHLVVDKWPRVAMRAEFRTDEILTIPHLKPAARLLPAKLLARRLSRMGRFHFTLYYPTKTCETYVITSELHFFYEIFAGGGARYFELFQAGFYKLSRVFSNDGGKLEQVMHFQ